ncbi:MAG: hypothetical protein ABTQ73_08040 [Caldilineales bacterium]
MAERNRSYLPLIVAFFAGLLLGWIVLGWLVAPVKWTGALLQDLRSEDQQVLLVEQAQSYALTRDAAAAGARLEALGDKAHVSKLAEKVIADAQAVGNGALADQMRGLAAAFNLEVTGAPAATGGEAAPTASPATAQPEPAREDKGGNGILSWLGLLLVLGGIALGAWYLLRRRSSGDEDFSDVESLAVLPMDDDDRPPYRPGSSTYVTPPVAERSGISQEFVAAYTQGDEDYDESFDIEGPDGSYWGECGMTASETLHDDDGRVTALEVWLFDKTDIRTVTKVLMSDYAYGNPALREKLSPRGDAILLAPDKGFVLDAQTLRLLGKVVEMGYDNSQAPASSTLNRLRVQLRVLRQPPVA